ncbi:MAG: MFS transporter [Anaerolineales bacterium]|nr:MFS transporter [Anaerolineales bacterium]
MANSQTNTKLEKGSAFEWWMIAYFGLGAGFSAFVRLLIPPYVTEATGSAAAAGLVMAIMSLSAVSAPALGGFADRYRAHRLILNMGMFGIALAFAAYALSAGDSLVTALDAIILGVSVAAINAIAPVFIVSAGLSKGLEAKRLTTLNLMAPIGQTIGGAILGWAATAGLTYDQRFWVAAVFMLGSALIVLFTTAKPAARIQVAVAPADDGAEVEAQKPTGLKQVLFSTFGLYLLILIFSSVAFNGFNAQVANIFPKVFGFSEALTSTVISLAGILGIIGFFTAGAWMARSGPTPVYTGGTVLRFAGIAALAVLGVIGSMPALIVVVAAQILYFSRPFGRLPQPVIGVRFATISAGQATGWIGGAGAIGSFVGALLGGWLADAVGFNAILWMGTISGGIALLLVVFALWPAERKKRAEESAAAAAAG